MVLVGWQFNIEVFKRILPGLVAMNPMTAICFILSATAVLLLRIHPVAQPMRVIATMLALSVALIGGAVMSRYIWILPFWPDRLFFTEKLNVAGQIPNVMAPNTALCFLLMGLALLLLDFQIKSKIRIAQFVSVIAALIALFAILGYVYDSYSLIGVAAFIPIALHTAVCFLLLATAVLASRPKNGIMFLYSNEEAAGFITRRLLVVAILMPAILGWLRIMGQNAGLYDNELGATLLVVATIFMLVLINSISGGILYRKEKEVEKAKDEFLGLATHQLQTPLTGVKLQLGVLQEGYYGKLLDEQLNAVNEADDANEREIRIVQDLLNVAHADSGRMVLKKAETNLKELVANIVKEQSSTITQRKQTVALHAKNVVVPVDAHRIRMAIENLLSNASKYTPDGGTLEVEVSETSNEAKVRVSDTGVGIDKKDITKLFGKFTRLDNPLSQVRGGTGLGMYLVRKIVDLHGGSIDVQSEVGKGSTFTIILPKEAVAAKA